MDAILQSSLQNQECIQLQGDVNVIGSVTNPTAVVQGLNNVQIGVGNINLVGGDFINVHHHHHYEKAESQVEIPSALQRVPNFRDIQIATLGKATAGTGDWIYVWEEFSIWLAPDGYIRILWGSGMPGAGKTILASLAIRAVERQTIERHPASLSLCNEVYAKHVREKTEPSTEELLELLKRFTSELMTTTFYFLDALDEAPAEVQLDLIESLTSLNVKLFITSRPMKSLEARLPGAHHFPIVAQDSDLDIHINREISRNMELQEIIATASPGLGGRITLTIKRKCSGMFLHASLQLRALRECTNRRDVEKTLEDFPPDIADFYDQTWTRIVNQAPGKASLSMNILAWVLHATRPLTVEELQDAIASCPETHSFDKTGLVSGQMMVGVCCGLLTIEKETGIAGLVHYTAKAILQDLILQSIPNPHSLLAAVCMARLRDGEFQRSAIASAEDLDKTLELTPLLKYAYHAWSIHGRQSIHDPAAKLRLVNFVQGCRSFPVLPRRYGKFDRFGPLHVAAAFNLSPSLAGPDQLQNLNQPSQEEGLTPLHLASMRNSRLAVEELLSLPRILVNAPDKTGSTALVWASWASDRGDEACVRLLLSHPKIKVNQATTDGMTALHSASYPGRTRTVKLLLTHPKIDVNHADNDGTTPFMIACTSKNTETVNAFLAHRKLKINSVDKDGRTALTLMMLRAHQIDVDMAKALLAHPQIDVNHRDKSGSAASYYAQLSQRQDLISLFLAHPKFKPTFRDEKKRMRHFKLFSTSDSGRALGRKIIWSKLVVIVGNPGSGPAMPTWHGSLPENQLGIGAADAPWLAYQVSRDASCPSPVAFKSFLPPTTSIPLVHLLAAALDNDDADDADDDGDIQRDFIGDLMLVAAHVPQQREATRPYSKHPRIACSHHASISSLLVVVPILYAMKVIPPLLKTFGMYFHSHVSARYVVGGSKGLAWICKWCQMVETVYSTNGYIDIAFSFTAGVALTAFAHSILLHIP
ncbi:hypothetical protein BKA70DRAFT_1230564 [Coprinopsis sp. MPI-PUGE-AT-0042]|nr:hypothetical protein BKA70DRAFT_1230564 [Coprinopsis sp. MPI-PUGE-AT-0042]